MPSSFTFEDADSGQHRFAVEFETAGTQSITATDTANASITGTESGIDVLATPRFNSPVTQSGTTVVIVQKPDFNKHKRTSIRPSAVPLTVQITPLVSAQAYRPAR